MRLAYRIFFLVALAGIVYVLIRAASGPGGGPPLARYARGEVDGLSFATAGQSLPAARVTGPDGQLMTLEAYKGKVLLVNVWATWCPPCEAEMPGLGALQKAKGGETFDVIAVSIDAPDDEAYARRRLTELSAGSLAFHQAPPGTSDFSFEAGVTGFPTSILYNADGTEAARLEGDADWTSPEAVSLIEALLKQ